MKRLFIYLFVMACPIAVWCQTGIEGKLSISSQMFVKEYVNANGSAKSKGVNASAIEVKKRIYATPETIDGRDYISCFLRLKDLDEVKELDELGVQIQCRFNKGLVTHHPQDARVDECGRHSDLLARCNRCRYSER